ncbi:MAG: class I SAM-dependent methyltransferase [Acidobacteria bacterium]|nr:class I SAM-dependent methyltransferase [Acidobacteriota bacterium]
MSEWFEDESFWQDFYSFLFPTERLSGAEEEVDKILARVNLQCGSVLDLCCGPGRHSIALARRGFRVTGVDRSPFLLDKARGRADDAQLHVEWIKEDMRRFVRPCSYDLALNMFTSFGYFEDKGEDVTVLRNIRSSLKAKGWLVMDMVGKEVLARIFQPTTSDSLPDGSLLVQRHQIVDGWTRAHNEWILMSNGVARGHTFRHTIYSGQEISDRLSRAGFVNIKLYGDLDGAEYGVHAGRLVALAQNP